MEWSGKMEWMDYISYTRTKISEGFFYSFWYIFHLFGKIQIEYILIVIVFSWILFIIYLKVSYPFWFIQPVYHTYNIYPRFARDPYIIQNRSPRKTTFCDFKNIVTIPYELLSELQKQSLLRLLLAHYIDSDSIFLSLTGFDIDLLFRGQKYSSYISFFTQEKFIQDQNMVDEEIEQEKQETKKSLIYRTIDWENSLGCMISRPIWIFFSSFSNDIAITPTVAYYWDYICIHRDHKTRNLSRNLIQTNAFNIRMIQPSIYASLFKKETYLCPSVVPLTKYTTHTYFLHNSNITNLSSQYKINRIQKSNMQLWEDFIDMIKSPEWSVLFDISLINDIGTYSSWILSEKWLVYILTYREKDQTDYDIGAVYIFQDPKIIYEVSENPNGLPALQFIASVNIMLPDLLFFRGFLHALRDAVRQNVEKTFRVLLFETISHNSSLLQRWQERNVPSLETDTALYLYNMVCPGSPIIPERVLCLV